MNNRPHIFFSILWTVIVLWQLLLGGYVLTLDMVFGPRVDLAHGAGDLLNLLPLQYFIAFLTFIFGGWVTQKIFLILLFSLLFYLPLYFFKKIFELEDTNGAEYVASLFFAINPFVYERFLAGHILLLFGYALLIPFTAYLIAFCREWNYGNLLKLAGIITLLGAISPHVFVMAVIVAKLACIVSLVKMGFNAVFLKKCLVLGLAILVFNSYWLIPAVFNDTSPLIQFNQEHWQAFRTAGSDTFGTLSNVLSLHGFWGEHEHWITRFVLPKEGAGFSALFSVFVGIILIGLYIGLKDRKLRGRVLFMFFIFCLSVIFSSGVGTGIFKNFNMQMFEHIPFWSGFRDSQKWSAVVALFYSLFAGLGVWGILARAKSNKYKKIIFISFLTLPIIYIPMMLFGFANQLTTVQYPDSWREVNNVLRGDKNCRALFLPWHQYYSLKFNNDILTANTSRSYFDCDIIYGRNMELGGIESHGGNGVEYGLIEGWVIDNSADPEKTIEFLRQWGIKYIIFTNDLVGEDIYIYPFLESSKLQTVINSGDIRLYKIY